MENTPDTFGGLFIGYSVIWALIVLFCGKLALKQNDLHRRLKQLEETSSSSTAK